MPPSMYKAGVAARPRKPRAGSKGTVQGSTPYSGTKSKPRYAGTLPKAPRKSSTGSPSVTIGGVKIGGGTQYGIKLGR